MTFARTRPLKLALLFWIWITRYCRPNTVWNFGEKLMRLPKRIRDLTPSDSPYGVQVSPALAAVQPSSL